MKNILEDVRIFMKNYCETAGEADDMSDLTFADKKTGKVLPS
jgi:hypothetical protein